MTVTPQHLHTYKEGTHKNSYESLTHIREDSLKFQTGWFFLGNCDLKTLICKRHLVLLSVKYYETTYKRATLFIPGIICSFFILCCMR